MERLTRFSSAEPGSIPSWIMSADGRRSSQTDLGSSPRSHGEPTSTGTSVVERIFSSTSTEGSISYFYQDHKGYPTVGRGFLVKTRERLATIRMICPSLRPGLDGRVPNSTDCIRKNWELILNHRPKNSNRRTAKPHSHFKQYLDSYFSSHPEIGMSTCAMTSEQMDSETRRVIRGFVNGCRRFMDDFDSAPPSAQVAIVRISYGSGPPGLFRQMRYGRAITAAILTQDWGAAIRAVGTMDISEQNKRLLRGLFRRALTE